MSIRRVRLTFETQFVQIPNEWLRDVQLSRRARGLLAELMTHEVGWEITIESLVDRGPEGRDAIRAAIGELETAGYLRRDQLQTDGRFSGVDYVIQDPRITSVGKSDVGKTDVGKSALKKTILKEHQGKEHHPRVRATSFPADFVITDELRAWAGLKTPGLDVEWETEKFKNHAEANARKAVQWKAAWKNWMLKAAEYAKTDSAAVAAAPKDWW